MLITKKSLNLFLNSHCLYHLVHVDLDYNIDRISWSAVLIGRKHSHRLGVLPLVCQVVNTIQPFTLTIRVFRLIRRLVQETSTTLSKKRFDTKCRRFYLLMVTITRENWTSSGGSRASNGFPQCFLLSLEPEVKVKRKVNERGKFIHWENRSLARLRPLLFQFSLLIMTIIRWNRRHFVSNRFVDSVVLVPCPS